MLDDDEAVLPKYGKLRACRRKQNPRGMGSLRTSRKKEY